MSITVQGWLDHATAAFQAASAWRQLAAESSPRQEALWLLGACLQKDLAWLYTWSDRELPESDVARADAWLSRRCAGEPLAYLTGRRDFWSLSLQVTPATLIPRPDSECLVSAALTLLPETGDVLDLGAGSGAIALALACERPRASVTAVDRCPQALAVAAANGERLRLPVCWMAGDWFAPVAGRRFDLVVSNPPYLAAGDPHLPGLAWEPLTALVAGDDGLDDFRRIVAAAPAHLRAGGWLLVEHGAAQAADVAALLQARGFTAIRHWQDWGGQDRVTGGCWQRDNDAD